MRKVAPIQKKCPRGRSRIFFAGGHIFTGLHRTLGPTLNYTDILAISPHNYTDLVAISTQSYTDLLAISKQNYTDLLAIFTQNYT